MTSRFNDPWNKSLDGADCPQDGIQRDDIERLLQPGAHDILPMRPANNLCAVQVMIDLGDQEVLIERGKESVLVKGSEINGVIAMLLRAKDMFSEKDCEGK